MCKGSEGSAAVMRMSSAAQDELWQAVARGEGAAVRRALDALRIAPVQVRGCHTWYHVLHACWLMSEWCAEWGWLGWWGGPAMWRQTLWRRCHPQPWCIVLRPNLQSQLKRFLVPLRMHNPTHTITVD